MTHLQSVRLKKNSFPITNQRRSFSEGRSMSC